MFTGIVEELGEVLALDRHADGARLRVRAPSTATAARLGDSVAVDGVCLTVSDVADGSFSADLLCETLERTSLGETGPGAMVNLERPLTPTSLLSGHLVQGHVDGVGVLGPRVGEKVFIQVPPALTRYLVAKGSVAVDGVSLTVVSVDGDAFSVALIPETLARTTLGHKRAGALVNVEVDVLAKYVEKLLVTKGDMP
jgi:riboflavin synthase